MAYYFDTSVSDDDPDRAVYGVDTIGIVDTEQGGIIAYVHKDNSVLIINALLDMAEGK